MLHGGREMPIVNPAPRNFDASKGPNPIIGGEFDQGRLPRYILDNIGHFHPSLSHRRPVEFGKYYTRRVSGDFARVKCVCTDVRSRRSSRRCRLS